MTKGASKYLAGSRPLGKRRNWAYILKRAALGFIHSGSSDLAAGLTFYSVLSIFPALLALLSLLGLFGQSEETSRIILTIIKDHTPAEVSALLEEPIRQLTTSPSAGLAFITGIAGALWSASSYIGALGRALNQVYQIPEGRSFLALRLYNLVLTTLFLFLITGILLLLFASQTVLEKISLYLPHLLSDSGGQLWLSLRLPLIFLLSVGLLNLLYYWAPNIKQQSYRLLTPGAALALVLIALASWGFNLYVDRFSNYNATYGVIAGLIILLLIVWICNNALLLGAYLDLEIQRNQNLRAGIAAEDGPLLPPRHQSKAIKIQASQQELIEEGRQLRLAHQEESEGSQP